ncbi:MAG: tail fiber domain-containing protein, partial [Bacteroidota bacterium]
GFAVGGFNPAKGNTDYYLNVEYNDNPEIIDPSQARMLWYPYREAFRSGRVFIEHVDSVGVNSMATGFESKAIGDYSQAFGYQARAFGNNSTAIGISANSEGESSFAFGSGTQAIGLGSFAFGYVAIDTITGLPINGEPTIASGTYSFALGLGAKAESIGSFAFGNNTIANGEYSNSFGNSTLASGNFSTAMGFHTTANGIYSTATGCRTTASGEASTSLGYWNNANGKYSTALGAWNSASGNYSTALGYLIGADAAFSFGIGLSSTYYSITQSNTMAIMGGNVGIGTVSPSYLLEVNGTAAKPGGGTWLVSSDERLKDIQGNYYKGLAEIIRLQPVKFNYKADNPRKLPSDINYVGFIAQDVQKIFPEAVSERNDGFLDFDMHSINVAMINAIKEHQQIIENQNSEIELLKMKLNELESLESRIDELESIIKASVKK